MSEYMYRKDIKVNLNITEVASREVISFENTFN